MISRDWILRQVQQLTQALSQVLQHKREGRREAAEDVLKNTIQQVTGLELARLRELEREEVLELCAATGTFNADQAVALADLLSEDAAEGSRRRALWLYDAALRSGGAVPLDVHERLAALRASLAKEE